MTATTETLDATEVFVRSSRFDLAFKAALALAWRDGDKTAIRRAESAYLEMMRARTDFYESVPPDFKLKNSPRAFLESFRRTAASLLRGGFSPAATPVPIDAGTGELLNGAHRVAACFAYGLQCRVARFATYYYEPGGSVAGEKNFHHLDPAVENFGVRSYVMMNTRARIVKNPPEGAVVWHRRGGYCVASIPSGADAASRKETLALLDALYPDMPFPDWKDRARRMRLRSLVWELARLRYLLLARVRTGRKREKSIMHAMALRRRALGFARLARAVERIDGR